MMSFIHIPVWLRSLSVLLGLLFTPCLAQAVPLVADVSNHRIEIHSGFIGTQILLFGARNDPGDIVVAIRGPEKNFIVRRKERTLGMWVNREEERFDHQPHFYAIASSRELNRVSQFHLFDPLGLIVPESVSDNPFREALRRILAEQEVYAPVTGSVDFMGETLFKATFNFPDNMPRGTYTAEVYLFSDGQLSGMQTIPIEVEKIGFDAFLYDAAHHHRLIYGLITIALALGIGWTASWLFQRI